MAVQSQSSFFGKAWVANLIIALLLLLGLGIRLLDLTDLPLDFNPARQLFSATKARGMYYQYAKDVPEWKREMAIEQWDAKADVEPPVMPVIVAGMYLIFGEHIWFGRLIASLAWMIGGLALYGLARRIASLDGAIIALAYYLFMEFGVIASRSFQPDPLMIGLTLAALWAFVRWDEELTWKWTLFAGLLSGAAIFVKNVAVFPLFVAFALVILRTHGLGRAIKDPQVWVLAVITALPTAIYMIDGLFISKNMDTAIGLRFFPQLWTDPAFYVRWRNIIANNIGFGAFLLALLGIYMAHPGRDRSLLTGTLVGYLLYGFVFSYHISTHNYYQLPLMIFISLSLAVVGKTLFRRMIEINDRSVWPRLVVLGFISFGIGSAMWNVRVDLVKDDFRNEPQFWAKLGDKLGHTTPVLGLTQDYGNRLAYWGWQREEEWPTTGDQNLRELAGKAKTFDEIFADRIAGKPLFVVTHFKQFDSQPELKEKLFDTYPVLEETPEYIIFDLQHPLEQP
jgi:4-amino-4-deoxy-L-arabinose transferase-like glycosyltransferase